jgi:hypothetical protein
MIEALRALAAWSETERNIKLNNEHNVELDTLFPTCAQEHFAL